MVSAVKFFEPRVLKSIFSANSLIRINSEKFVQKINRFLRPQLQTAILVFRIHPLVIVFEGNIVC